mmetsp:Transcript_9381/g.14284  ORF Transcript_9381/g.14284 Transcript_9381/m.14284 type:complete len:108 (+) Transcript_9381:405-728(+)
MTLRNQKSRDSNQQLSASTHLHLSGLSESRQEDSKQPNSKRNSGKQVTASGGGEVAVLNSEPRPPSDQSPREESSMLGHISKEKSSTLSHPLGDKDIKVHGSSTLID